MIKKLLYHLLGATLILFGWYICVTSVGLDRGAVSFRYFSPTNVIGLVMIYIGAYFPEIMTRFFSSKSDS